MSKLFAFLLCFPFAVQAQWNDSILLSMSMGGAQGSGEVILNAAVFESETWGMYALSSYVSPSSGYVARLRETKDGGMTWNDISSDSRMVQLYAADEHIFVVREDDINGLTSIFRYNKNGQRIQVGSAVSLTQLTIVDSTLFYGIQSIYSTQYFLLKHDNGTFNFQHYDFGMDISLKYISFPSEQIGYVHGVMGNTDNVILKTLNGGSDWDTIWSDPVATIRGMHFIDNQTGFLIGENGYVAKSTDGGQNWSILSVGSTEHLNSLHFRNVDEGLVVGDSGTILHTQDGGQSWQLQTAPTTRDFIQVFYVDDSVGFARAGNVFYKSQNTIGLAVEELEILKMYPNPSTGTLIIDSEEELLRIEMIDTNGKLIFSMTNPDTSLSLSHLPTGMYFVKFTTKTSTITKKLMLVKE